MCARLRVTFHSEPGSFTNVLRSSPSRRRFLAILQNHSLTSAPVTELGPHKLTPVAFILAEMLSEVSAAAITDSEAPPDLQILVVLGTAAFPAGPTSLFALGLVPVMWQLPVSPHWLPTLGSSLFFCPFLTIGGPLGLLAQPASSPQVPTPRVLISCVSRSQIHICPSAPFPDLVTCPLPRRTGCLLITVAVTPRCTFSQQNSLLRLYPSFLL